MLLMLITPVVGFVSVFYRPLLDNFYNLLESKLKEIVDFKELQRNWGYALLNCSGRMTEPVDCGMDVFE